MLLNGGTFNGTRIIADSTVALFTRRSAGTRALGWDTCAGEFGCGKYMSANAYGHTGYTGTSLWIDPDRDMFVVLLTNRVHAARARRPAKVISDVRADLADAAALAVTDLRGGPLVMPRSFRADRAVGWNRPDVKVSRAKAAKAKRAAAARARARARRKANARKSSSSTKKKASSRR
jgi:CubicO group peptidase (beta-lactamase class C family)